MIHAGGGAGFGHSTAASGAGGMDVQPLASSINISPQAVIFIREPCSSNQPHLENMSFESLPRSESTPL